MQNIVEYIELTKEQRQAHINLLQPCSEIGGSSSIEFKGLLAYFLNTTIPTHQGHRILLCHACGNGKCSNVKHLYWGTAKENYEDAVNHGSQAHWVHKVEQKRGKEFVTENAKRAAQISADARRGKTKDFEEFRERLEAYAPYPWGWASKAAIDLGISHTQIGRIARRLNLGL